MICGLFFVPVTWLCLIQTGNFTNNKTTMERFTKVSQFDDEKKIKLVYSGIKDDNRIIIDSYKYQALWDQESGERMITEELIRKSENLDPHFTQNVIKTEEFFEKNGCERSTDNYVDFCCQKQIRPQAAIYENRRDFFLSEYGLEKLHSESLKRTIDAYKTNQRSPLESTQDMLKQMSLV